MCFSIFLRFAYKFRLEMAPINHLLMNYLRDWLMQERLQPTSRICWGRLQWRGMLRNRLLRRGMLWCRLLGRGLLRCRLIQGCLIWLIWRQLLRCIMRTSRRVIVIIVVITIVNHVVLSIIRGWHSRTFYWKIVKFTYLVLMYLFCR